MFRRCVNGLATCRGFSICSSSSSRRWIALALKGISPRTIDMALVHSWPGNVRELRNRVERAVALARSEWIMPGDMFPDLNQAPESVEGDKAFATLSEARDMAERRQIERALQETNGHILEAAKLLGVSRTTLWEKMRRLNITGELFLTGVRISGPSAPQHVRISEHPQQ